MTLPTYDYTRYYNFNTDNEAREAFESAISCVQDKLLGQDWPMIINGEHVTTGEWVERYNPCDTSMLIGRVAKGTKEHAEAAINAASEMFDTWRKVPADHRARYLLRAAASIKKNYFKWCALETLESGKNWNEADGDVAEAIDFLEFYARRMMEMDRPHPTTPFEGQENMVQWIPLGPCLVIPPWNFPLAIMAGMTMACVVAGNTVVLKPSPRSPIIASLFLELLEDLQLPAGVINMVQGDPEEIGDYMVDHPKIRLVSFTGSRAVGCRIYERAAKVNPGQKWLKRVIAEMGGKDAMLIDEGVDLDAAADAITAAAYGFQGQKCSACSRVIAHEAIHDELLAKCVERANAIKIGPAHEKDSGLAAVVDEASYKNILSYIEIGKTEGKLECGGEAAQPGPDGYYIKPTIISGINKDHRIHCEEIFGPVVAFIKVKDFSEGIEVANATDYGLTGGVFTQSRENLELAREEFHVGNLYLNRKCTGAIVDVQPFGGFNMSGTDDKAGGREHLYRFMQAKTISEQL